MLACGDGRFDRERAILGNLALFHDGRLVPHGGTVATISPQLAARLLRSLRCARAAPDRSRRSSRRDNEPATQLARSMQCARACGPESVLWSMPCNLFRGRLNLSGPDWLCTRMCARCPSLFRSRVRAKEGEESRIRTLPSDGGLCVCARAQCRSLFHSAYTHIHNRSSILACARRKVKKEEQGRLRAMGWETKANVRP